MTVDQLAIDSARCRIEHAPPAASSSPVGPVRPAGAFLLHPAFLGALCVLVLNDHVLKRAVPSMLTGKLSDFAGVFLFPLILQALYELAATRALSRAPSALESNSALFVSAIVTGIGFALPEISRSAELVYEVGLGALQWPMIAARALFLGRALPAIAPVDAVADPSDLCALPMALVALRFAWQRTRSSERTQSFERRLRLIAFLPFTVGFEVFLPARLARAESETAAEHAQPKAERRGKRAYTHDGFFLEADAAVGALYVSTESTVSNGFQQGIASSALGPAVLLSGSLGGTPAPGLVLAARFIYGEANEPVISTLGERFQLRDFKLVVADISAFARYYPDPTHGLNFGASLGIFTIRTDGDDNATGSARDLAGPSFSIEGGMSFWLSRQLSFGPVARLLAAYLIDEHAGHGTVLMPAFLLGLTWH